jgi:hypothetical protein
MKKYVFGGVLILWMAAVSSGLAFENVEMHWRGTVLTTNLNGRAISKPWTEKEIINLIASNFGETNKAEIRDWVLAYRFLKRDVSVIKRSTGEFIADVIQLEYNYTEFPRPDGGNDIQVFLFQEPRNLAIGSAVGTVRLKFDVGGTITSFSFNGAFNYLDLEADATPKWVVKGSFVTGRPLKDTPTMKKKIIYRNGAPLT